MLKRRFNPCGNSGEVVVAIDDLISYAANNDLNEADTRFHIIDRLLRDVLGWPTSAFKLEPSTVEGYSDYHLLRPNGSLALIVEAKRTGVYFDLPANFNYNKPIRQVKAATLLTSESLKKAMIQAQRYCSDEGCEFAAVTNGRQFVIFKAFEKGKSWKSLPAVVITDLLWFRESLASAMAFLGYSSVIERNSLKHAFENSQPDTREIFFPKEKIASFNQIINANALASALRPIVQKYFGPIDVTDREFVDRCYVSQRAHDKSLKGIRSLIQDSISPFMESYGIQETGDEDSGGAFASRLSKSVRRTSGGDVVVLFGGKGSGKSTFIKKVLIHKPPQFLKKHSAPIIIDLLAAPKDKSAVREHLWQGLISRLDSSNLLLGDRDELLKLFDDRFSVARRQDLKGLFEDSATYNERLNDLLAEWRKDQRYVASRLVRWHHQHHRGVIVAVDNTDQLENELQDYAFSLAAEVSQELGCLVLISMREERFYASKLRGMLDAYQNSAFHISSPTPAEVFGRRIAYVIDLLKSDELEVDQAWKEDVRRFFEIFRNDFARDPISPLNRFISASAHGNIRLALDLFGDLILSGYTNATEMTQSTTGWSIQIHQVLRPLLTPTRLFYDEKLSKVPNLFQIRSLKGGSHFTGLRMLKYLSQGQDPGAPAYVSQAQIRSYFAETFGGDEDFRQWADRLLASNLVEASTRQDYFTDEVDSMRITSFGQFALAELHKIFTYIDLDSTDCGVRDESVCNELVRLSNSEVQLLAERKRFERVQRRIEKAEAFLGYLKREEEKEIDFFGLPSDSAFVPSMIEAWAEEKPRVLQSARRNR